MREYYLDNFLLGLKPFSFWHHFGVNGKIAGSLAAIHEMERAVPVLYGPRGCGFHYRYSARSRNTPYYELECADIQDRDVVFGAEERLCALLRQIDAEQRPELIFVLPTVVSDIINDDLAGIVEAVQPELRSKVVAVRSQAFSHMDKSNTRKRLQERASCTAKRAGCSAVYPGCGYVEVMDAVVEQLMEPQTVEPRTVNLESFIWGFGGEVKLRRMLELLEKIGVQVNTLLPACSLEQMRQAPRAQLNIVRRRKWALAMQQRFGTDFLHIADMQEWHGLQGIKDYYLTIAAKLGLQERAESVLAEEKKAVQPQLDACRALFAKHRFALISGSLAALPEQIMIYEQDFGLPLSSVCLILNPSFQKEAGVDGATLAKMHERIDAAMAEAGCKARLYFNPTEAELRQAVQECDFVLAGSNPRYNNLGRPVLPTLLQYSAFDFVSFAEIMQAMAQRLSAGQGLHDGLLLSRLEYDAIFYPMAADDKNTRASREMYTKLWRTRRR